MNIKIIMNYIRTMRPYRNHHFKRMKSFFKISLFALFLFLKYDFIRNREKAKI